MKDDLISRMSLRESILASLILGGEKTLDQIIDEEPSVDAVKVVRCKDCKAKAETEDGEYNPEDIVCTYWMSDGLNEDDYCSYGERKEE